MCFIAWYNLFISICSYSLICFWDDWVSRCFLRFMLPNIDLFPSKTTLRFIYVVYMCPSSVIIYKNIVPDESDPNMLHPPSLLNICSFVSEHHYRPDHLFEYWCYPQNTSHNSFSLIFNYRFLHHHFNYIVSDLKINHVSIINLVNSIVT